ncbi:hypothetical protein N7524_005762 [Penicillium chrysogenum]|nr:hypothetical protein N7524_005762 [Penicillium chrysogenum]
MSTIPQGPVEARSLSSVTTIASNPPRLPSQSNSREARTAVFVHCACARKQSVSAEAINASLYYLHVATPDDDTLLQEVEEEREEEAQLRKERLAKAGVDDPAQREFARLNNVRRKPVGGGGDLNTEPSLAPPKQDATAPPALPLRPTPALQDEIASPALPPRPIPMPQDDAAQDATAPPALPPRPVPMPQVTAENVSFSGTPVANMQPPLTNNTSGGVSVESGGKSGVSRRPLPPLPPGEESWTNSAAGEDPSKRTSRWSAFTEQLQNRGENWRGKYEAKYEAFAAGRHSLDSNGPQLRPRSSHNRTGSPLGSPGQSPNRHRNEHDDPHSNAGFHITLIRRDPTSGTQWNVATISTPRMDRNAVDIEISTPGYNRFAGSNEMPSLSSLAANLPTGIGRLPNSAIVQSLAAEQPKEQPTGPRKFHRQLCVSKPFDDTVATDMAKQKHPPAVTVAELRFNTPFQAANLHSHAHHAIHKPHPNHLSPFTQSQIQTPSVSRPNDNPNDNNPSLEGGPLHPSSSNNSFAAAKRNSLSQFLNPNAYARPRAHTGPGSTPPHPASPPRRLACKLQPLNPPPQNLYACATLRTPEPAPPRFSAALAPHSGGDLDYDSDEDRLDLSLARENAGGGLRGKSAKLGKLVIEDEGIKMLDLVVAACMAVWWRGYYY